MQVSALSVKKLDKPGYRNKSSWPWTASQEDKHLRLECQQRHVVRLEREVEATGKRKKGGTSEWVSYPEVSLQAIKQYHSMIFVICHMTTTMQASKYGANNLYLGLTWPEFFGAEV